MTKNDLQNITHKTKDRVTRAQLKTGAELRCYDMNRKNRMHIYILISIKIREYAIYPFEFYGINLIS